AATTPLLPPRSARRWSRRLACVPRRCRSKAATARCDFPARPTPTKPPRRRWRLPARCPAYATCATRSGCATRCSPAPVRTLAPAPVIGHGAGAQQRAQHDGHADQLPALLVHVPVGDARGALVAFDGAAFPAVRLVARRLQLMLKPV